MADIDTYEAAKQALTQLETQRGEQAEREKPSEEPVEDPDATNDEDDGDTPDEGGDGDGVDTEDVEPDEGDDQDVEDEDDGEEDEEPQPLDGPLSLSELPEDTPVVLSDGTETTVGDLNEGGLRLKDYTQKTQATAEERRELEGMREELEGWSQELTEFVDAAQQAPAEFIAGIAGQSPNPTLALVEAIKATHEAGKLDHRFAQMLNLGEPGTPVADVERDGKIEQSVAQLQAAEDARQEQAQQAQAAEEARQRLLAQWEQVKADEGLTFTTPAEEQQLLGEVAKFGNENGLADIKSAYAQRELRRLREEQAAPQVETKQPKQKQSLQAITRRSKGSGGGGQAPGATGPKKYADTREAAMAAVRKMG